MMRLRPARGMSQAELAKRVGVDQSEISNYERGASRLFDRLIVDISKALRVSPSELLGMEKSKVNPEPIYNRRILQRLQMIERLSKRDQQALFRVMDGLLAKRNGGGDNERRT